MDEPLPDSTTRERPSKRRAPQARSITQKTFVPNRRPGEVARATDNRPPGRRGRVLGHASCKDRDKFENIVGRSSAPCREVLGCDVRIEPPTPSVSSPPRGQAKSSSPRRFTANSSAPRPFGRQSYCDRHHRRTLVSMSEIFLRTRASARSPAPCAARRALRGGRRRQHLLRRAAETPIAFQRPGSCPRQIPGDEIRRVAGQNKAVKVGVRIIAAEQPDLKGRSPRKRFRRTSTYASNVAAAAAGAQGAARGLRCRS